MALNFPKTLLSNYFSSGALISRIPESTLYVYDLSSSYGFISRQYNAQAIDCIIQMIFKIEIFSDRLPEKVLLQIAQTLMIRFIGGGYLLVMGAEISSRVHFRPVNQQTICAGMRVNIV